MANEEINNMHPEEEAENEGEGALNRQPINLVIPPLNLNLNLQPVLDQINAIFVVDLQRFEIVLDRGERIVERIHNIIAMGDNAANQAIRLIGQEPFEYTTEEGTTAGDMM